MRWMMLSLAVGALVVSGCASLSGGPEIDYKYVARIENAAKVAGVSVYWINYPTIRSTSSVN